MSNLDGMARVARAASREAQRKFCEPGKCQLGKNIHVTRIGDRLRDFRACKVCGKWSPI